MMRTPDLKALKNRALDFRRDVIRMMRLKFICVAMAILIAVFLTMLTAINIIMNTVSQSQSMRLLEQIALSDRYDTISEPNRMLPPEQFDDTMPPDTPQASDVSSAGEGAAAELPGGSMISLANYLEYPGHPGWGDWEQRPEPTAETGEWEDEPWNRDDRPQPPDWGDNPHPSEDIPPPWETENPTEPMPPTDPPATETPPPVTEPESEPTAPPAEDPAEYTDPVSEDPSDVTEETTETETETESVPQTETPAPSETFPESQSPPEPREPRMNRWNVPITIDHFAILVNSEGEFLGLRNTEDYTDDEASEIMAGILAKGREQGMYGWLQFCTAPKSYGTLIVITDKTSDQGLLNNLFRTTVILGILMLLVLLGILIVLSRWITQPVQQAFKRQKQFVSDAGHELKTPVAVLTTNADILQDEIGENKWLIYMQEQIGRMNQLIGDLLRLARMDNATQEYTFADFDLSLAVAATTLPFESSAFEQHKTLEMDVQPGVHYNGSEQHIRQLCAIFIDNALKYSNDNGIIKVTLLQRGDHQVLEFYNTGCEISQSETEKIFERFYRGDKARNSTGKSGYGLGLAIAKSIMEIHKIKFQVTCEQGKWIRFLLTL